MKRTLLLLFVLSLFSANWNMVYSANWNMVYVEENKEIELAGNLPNHGTRSLSASISAVNYSDYIKVTLLKSLGEISIKIYDETNNIVYEEITDSSAQSYLSVSTVLFETGIYTIEFTNSQGRYLKGNFVIE